VHSPEELCRRRLNDKRATLAWDELLRGGYDSYPEAVPDLLATNVIGRGRVDDWELRAVEVLPASEDLIGRDGGWPGRDRAADASHPPLAPASRFVDTAEDIQIDPATLPENIELMQDRPANRQRRKRAADRLIGLLCGVRTPTPRTGCSISSRPAVGRAPRPSVARDAANHSSGAGPVETVSRPARSMWWVSL
jgi:hypothetical protein